MGDGFNDHWEDNCFKKLNTDILRSAGGDSWTPPSRSEILGVKDEFDKRIQDTIRSHERDIWGWKDPKTVFTMELYLPHLRGDVYLIYCLRTFSEVKKSLVERTGWSTKEGADHVLEEYRKRLKLIIDLMAEL